MALLEKSADYRIQLAQMCRTLFSSPIVQQSAPGIFSGAQQLLQMLNANQDCRTSFRLALEPNWKVELADPIVCGVAGQTELYFGGEIVFENQCLVRQVLTVVVLFRSNIDVPATDGRPDLVAGEDHIVRRFHFDFDRGVAGRDTPLAHVQVGGQLNREHLPLNDANQYRYQLFDQLDYPRLPWTITDLPIVLDTFLRQFPAGMDALVGGAEWRRCVMDSERLWLAGYFRQAAAMMDSEADRECLYDFCCAEANYDH